MYVFQNAIIGIFIQSLWYGTFYINENIQFTLTLSQTHIEWNLAISYNKNMDEFPKCSFLSKYRIVVLSVYFVPIHIPQMLAQRAADSTITVLPAYLVPSHLVTRLSSHFSESPPPFTYSVLKSDISSPGYLVILTSV